MVRRSAGFTLIEVIIAVLIGSLLLSSIYGVFGAVSAARDRLADEGIFYHQARIFFDRVGGELSSMRMAVLGNRAVLEGGNTVQGTTYLEFNTELVSPLQRQRGGLSRVRYEVREDGGALTLYRSEEMLLANLAASEPLVFISGLKAFVIRYYAAGQWHDSWSRNQPPQMIEFQLEVDSDHGGVIPFRSSFVLSGGRG
ncbi:type II secretion system protein GspJ [Pelovirga terrestris]|uniref:Type II secretion system protein J n=1 Tax=Pelovirga terrestris TaxID=2771352 RepID=A0A8J6QPN6_9BACT|nr:type II secretion system protein GspJ [Pelovirga terrestris]MBD1400481.1 prepilin-type N-terminal cleavage/methylation domain-containing protein [Pelovirga terrestris]